MAEGPGGRRLRAWLVAQLESGRFPGLEWDDAERTALRIPWQHGGKGGARGGAGAALCRAWSELKGRVAPGGGRWDAAGCKTRLRCALHKSPEFQEVPERSRLRGDKPYKVYRVLPPPRPRPARAHGKGGQHAGNPEERGTHIAPHCPTAPRAEPPPPPAESPSPLSLSLESREPLPPNEGPLRLSVSAWRGGSLAWRGWLPPGEYLLVSPPLPAEAPPLPRLVLRGAGLGGGVLLASAPRGIFVRLRRGAAVGQVRCRGPHLPGGGESLRPGELLRPFDSRSFREELSRHRAGLCPLPEHRVTLVVGQEPAPHGQTHGGDLVLQLEQAFAQPLLDASSAPSCPTASPHLPTPPSGCPTAAPRRRSPQ
ncbi:interferon regulatory factor 9-like [Cuculus canorus]|uniref:interferon regulatory factor 9-like n=1 Tax=Cuculus canorus TaxID=55661 RepID=UPI0023AB2306|nr:interferon regulatory factor 9-like [Cuculus canorus]